MTERDTGIPQDEYAKLPEFEPEREDIELDADLVGGSHRSLEEAEVSSSNMPDMQFALKRLFPTSAYKVIEQFAPYAMVARVHPDTYREFIKLTVQSVLDAWDYKKDGFPNVQLVINLVVFVFSIGLDGKGREDVHIVAGAAESAKELDKLSKEFGIAR